MSKRKKAGKIPGSIFKRGASGNWILKFKGIQRSTGLPATQEYLPHAKEMLKEWVMRYYRNTGKLTKRVLYSDAISDYYHHMKTNYSDSQMRVVNLIVKECLSKLNPNNYFNPDEVTSLIETYIKSMSQLKPSTSNRRINTLNTMVLFFSRHKLMDEQSYKHHLKPLVKESQSKKFYTMSEIRTILEKLRDVYLPKNPIIYYFFSVLARTGLRAISLKRLKPKHIDYSESTLLIINYKKKSMPTSRMAVTSEVCEQLKKAIEIQKLKDDDLIFGYSDDYFRRELKTILRELNLYVEGNALHLFRRAMSDHLTSQKLDWSVPVQILGHSSPTVTYGSYTNREKFKEAKEILESIEELKDL